MLKIAKAEEEEHAEFKLQHADDVRQVQNEWLNCLQKKFREENELAEQQIEVLLEGMLEQQIEVLPEEEKETQRFYNFDVCLMTAGTNGRTKICLVQEKRRDDDSD